METAPGSQGLFKVPRARARRGVVAEKRNVRVVHEHFEAVPPCNASRRAAGFVQVLRRRYRCWSPGPCCSGLFIFWRACSGLIPCCQPAAASARCAPAAPFARRRRRLIGSAGGDRRAPTPRAARSGHWLWFPAACCAREPDADFAAYRILLAVRPLLVAIGGAAAGQCAAGCQVGLLVLAHIAVAGLQFFHLFCCCSSNGLPSMPRAALGLIRRLRRGIGVVGAISGRSRRRHRRRGAGQALLAGGTLAVGAMGGLQRIAAIGPVAGDSGKAHEFMVLA